MGNAIVQATQQTAAKTCIDTYTNFKQLALSKHGVSHCLYFLNAAYSDPTFTSAEDETDAMVIVKLDISNAFGSLCTRLVLDVLSGKASRDYVSPVSLKLMKNSKQPCTFTPETILLYYDGDTN